MIEINLLPSGAGKRAPSRGKLPAGPSLDKLGAHPLIAGLAGVGVLVVLGLGFAIWRAGDRVTELRAEVVRENEESERLQRTIELVQTLDTRRDTIVQKIEVIRQVDGRRYVWPHLMDEISRAVPPFLWLTKVSATAERAPRPAPVPRQQQRGRQAQADTVPPEPAAPVGPGFTIEGNAGSTQSLTRFMKNLEDSPMVRDVGLVTSEAITEEGRSLLKFTLEARWREPDSAFIETVPLVAAP